MNSAITITFLRHLLWGIPRVGLFIVAFTFLSYFDFAQVEINESSSLLDHIYYNVIYHLDLRNEGNVATWFESVMFLSCAIPYYFLFLQIKDRRSIRAINRIVLMLVPVGLVFFSMDESASIHETIGKILEYSTSLSDNSKIQNKGYSWIFVYMPILLICVLFFYRCMQDLTREFAPSRWKSLRLYLSGIVVSSLLVIVCEFIEGHLVANGNGSNIVPCFEEMFEILTLTLLLYLGIKTFFIMKR